MNALLILYVQQYLQILWLQLMSIHQSTTKDSQRSIFISFVIYRFIFQDAFQSLMVHRETLISYCSFLFITDLSLIEQIQDPLKNCNLNKEPPLQYLLYLPYIFKLHLWSSLHLKSLNYIHLLLPFLINIYYLPQGHLLLITSKLLIYDFLS